jgi:hypothetical protein
MPGEMTELGDIDEIMSAREALTKAPAHPADLDS